MGMSRNLSTLEILQRFDQHLEALKQSRKELEVNTNMSCKLSVKYKLYFYCHYYPMFKRLHTIYPFAELSDRKETGLLTISMYMTLLCSIPIILKLY